MMRFIGRVGLRPPVAKVFEYEDLPKAYEALKSATEIGKIVIRIGK